MIAHRSRLIVKNLPPKLTEDKLREMFRKFGEITDASLKYTEKGVFRRFAFVGFVDDESCKKAVEKMNNTFYQGLKLAVEECQRFSAENKPRPWSKYSKESSAYKRMHTGSQSGATNDQKPQKTKKTKLEKKKETSKKDAKVTVTEEADVKNEKGMEENGESSTESKILDTGRLFLRNLPFICTEEDLTDLFKTFGTLSEVQCIVDKFSGKCKGFAIVTFMFPENALAAYKELDGTIFKGRMMHILAGEEKLEPKQNERLSEFALSGFQKNKINNMKTNANVAFNWNSLFLGANAVAENLAEKFEVEKRHLLIDEGENSAAVRMAMAETRLVKETREFLLANGVKLDAFSRPTAPRSKTTILVKNLTACVTGEELLRIFSGSGDVKNVLLPPERGVSALVEMSNEVDAKRVFERLAYSRLRNQPLYLEWAPLNVFDESHPARSQKCEVESIPKVEEKLGPEVMEKDPHGPEPTETAKDDRTKILVRNVPFQASPKEVQQLFSAFGEIQMIRMPKKIGSDGSHRGFCFVEYISVGDAKRAYDALVHSTHLYGRRLALEWAKKDETVDELRQKTNRNLGRGNIRKSVSRKTLRASIDDRIAAKRKAKEEEDE